MSSLWLDTKYANLVSSKLQKFKVKRSQPYLANFRCPYCGDSEASKSKARGYLFPHKGRLIFKCHNCGESHYFPTFLKFVDDVQYNDYRFESLKERSPFEEKEDFKPDIGLFAKPRFEHYAPLKSLKKISQLSPEHGAKKYVESRRIPRASHHKLYYTSKFAHWVNSLIPDKFDEQALKGDEPRLVIPLIDQNGYVFGFQGRSFRKGPNVLRYITIMLDEAKPKIFGLDTLDVRKRVHVVEGPIDSLFVPNCVAMVGADFNYELFANKQNVVVIFDNQPRNKEVVKKIEKVIEDGYNVVIWPETVQQKDINDMILSGMSQAEVLDIIDTATCSGLTAKLRFSQWKKI